VLLKHNQIRFFHKKIKISKKRKHPFFAYHSNDKYPAFSPPYTTNLFIVGAKGKTAAAAFLSVDFFDYTILGLSCSGLLAATHTKTLIGALATRFEVAPKRRRATVVGTDPTTTPPNPGRAAIKP